MENKMPDVWYATVEHYRAWLFADGGFGIDYARNGKTFDAPLIRRMASYYSVARTIPGVDPASGIAQKHDVDKNRKIVAKHLNGLARKWPDTLSERTECAIATADRICDDMKLSNAKVKADGITSKKFVSPYSAVTKFIWCARPTGWTLYDNFASNGILASGVGADRVRKFYAALDDGGFSELCDTLRPKCRLGDLQLWPERIIDVVLMLRGAEKGDPTFGNDIRANCATFLSIAPNAAALQKLADNVAKAFPDDALPEVSNKNLRALMLDR